MIFIYENTETEFRSNGLGTLAPFYCTIKEELNGMYELELEHSYDNLKKYERIENDRIIKAMTPRGYQSFRIYKIVTTLKSIKVYAKHLSYDLFDMPAEAMSIKNATPSEIINTLKSVGFGAFLDIETDLEGAVDNFAVQSTAVMKVLINSDKEKSSIIGSFGGEILRDNMRIKILKSIGRDRGFTVRYAKNLIGLDISEDYSNFYPIVFPIGKNNLRLSEQSIGLNNSSESGPILNRFKIKILELYDCSTEEELRRKAYEYFETSKTPDINIKVNFQLLSRTEEYKNYRMLEEVYLGDIVTVENTKLNFRKKSTVISYVYDCLLEKYREIELGDFVSDITKSISSVDRSLSGVSSAITDSKQILNLVSGKIGITEDSLYISVDGENYKSARKIFKFSSKGLEYSSTGYQGQYKTLIDNLGNIRSN